MSKSYMVRRQDIYATGGASYLIEASKQYDLKYRFSKCKRSAAKQFSSKDTAQAWLRRNDMSMAVVVEI